MCYRVATPPKQDLEILLGEGYKIEDWDPHFYVSGHTSPVVPVIKQADPHKVEAMQWGVKPWWISNPKDLAIFHNRTLNTMAEYGFRGKMPDDRVKEQQRCLLFVSGFYEHRWEDEGGKKKTPYFIYWPDHKPFALAGLRWIWVKEETGETYETLSILITKSNELLSFIHNNKNRMPVVMGRENWDTWLNPELDNDEIKRLTQPFPDGILKAHAINKIPTKTSPDVAETQQPVIVDETNSNELFK